MGISLLNIWHVGLVALIYISRDPNPNHDSLVPYLLRAHDNEDGICLDFFDEAVSRIPEDETVAAIFTDAMVLMSKKLATMTMNDDYKPYINVRLCILPSTTHVNHS